MTKRAMTLTTAALALGALLALAGCGGGGEEQQAAEAGKAAEGEQVTMVCSACGMEVTAEDAQKVEGRILCGHCVPKDQAAQEAVVVHDCAGPCGMVEVPEDQLVEIDGKWYCQGCAKNVQQDEDHDHTDGDHGHDHG